MRVAEEAAVRFGALAEEGDRIVRQPPMQGFSDSIVPHEMFNEWRTRSLNSMRAYLPDNHPSITEFNELVIHVQRGAVRQGVGILRGLAADAADGYLFMRMTTLITAEVFNDFLEMAEHLLEAEHYHAAAGLIGAVLEDSLRKIADAQGITYTKRDGIDSLNQALAKEGIYTAIVKKNVEVWKQVRNDSDHGHFDQVTLDDVRSMLRGVEDFLAQNLK